MLTELIVVHGPPGVGKETIGQILATRLGYPFVSSHRMMAEAGALLGWGSPAFLRVRDATLTAWQAELPTDGPSGLVWAVIFEPTIVLDGWDALFAAADRVLVVDLRVARHEHERRLASEGRYEAGKAGAIDDIARLVDEGVFDLPAMSAPVFTLDTTELSPDAAADAIVKRIGATPPADAP